MQPSKSTQADPATIRDAIRSHALALGFDTVGFGPARSIERTKQGLAAYLEDGFHGDMDWMQTTATRRADPQALWPDSVTAVVTGLNYGPTIDPMAALDRPETGAISAYAQTIRDYHDVVKKKLRALARWMAETYGCDVKLFVDTAPVMEKPLAQQAGVGWQGKHTNLVSREFGSWLFLGEVLTTLDLPHDPPEVDHCGSCQNCLDVCPTDAFPSPYRLDARRCIAYLTIEHQGHIPLEFREPIGNRVFGCDDCLAVCPWNKFAQSAHDLQMQPRLELATPDLIDLASLDDSAFRELFAQSPVKRLGRDRLLRNVLIAMGNSGQTGLAEHAKPHLTDPSPVVRAMAVWALARLVDHLRFEALADQHITTEEDPEVAQEWQAGLASFAVSGNTGTSTEQ
ncbi:MAG: tRNA epoxyqueuosine(34) reductase QueG [Alphaproteobacteria bacterium]|jgi:epoxyqueuosine reductase